jgi:hypothetical protein
MGRLTNAASSDAHHPAYFFTGSLLPRLTRLAGCALDGETSTHDNPVDGSKVAPGKSVRMYEAINLFGPSPHTTPTDNSVRVTKTRVRDYKAVKG